MKTNVYHLNTKLFLFFFVALLFNINARAATYTWSGGSAGSWTTSANWGGSGYPGSSGSTTDIAIVNTSNATITYTGNLTISQLQSSTYGVAGITINLSGASSTLTISGGLSTAQPSSAATGMTFSGTGTALIGGTTTLGYQSSLTIASGTTVTFVASSTFNFPNNHSNVTNNGKLNFSTGSTIALGDQTTITNTGTITSTKATIKLQGSGSPVNTINNQGTFRDHGSTINVTGQNASIQNSLTTSVCYLSGTSITFSTGNNGHSITNAGTFTADSATVITLGTQSCVITNSGTFYAGTSNNACSINLTGQGSNINNTGTFKVGSTSVLNPSGTSAVIKNTSGTFTLQSDSYGSATIASLSSTASCSGTFNIERYLTGGVGYRGYRLLSSQVYAATIGGSYNVYGINYLKNSIYLTGTSITGGFDNTTATANPSLYLFRENLTPEFSSFLNSNFIGISKINNATSYNYSMNDATYTSTYNIPVASGFLCFFRGDRSTSLTTKTTSPYPTPENTTLTTTGTLNTGTIAARNWFNAASTTLSYTSGTPIGYKGYNLVGNPYPSSIDWETYQSTNTGVGIYGKNISATIYVLNPKTQNFDSYTKGGGYTNYGTRTIVSGQAFFVIASGSSSSVTFYETAKVNTQNTGLNLFMGKPADQLTNNQHLRLQLAMDSINTDDIMINFSKGANPQFDINVDAPYLQGMGKVSLASLSSDRIPLAMNTLPLPKESETIGIKVLTKSDGVYRLNMTELVGLPKLFDIWLMDAYKKDSLDMRHNRTYSFDVVKSDTGTYGANRFTLVIRQNPGYAYHLLDFTATKATGKQVQLAWIAENEANYTNFTIERSIDGGNTFEVVGGMSSTGAGNYSLLDKNPSEQDLYRLKQEDINGSISYSKIIAVSFSTLNTTLAKTNVNVYPNPVSATINVSISNSANNAAKYNILITNSSGTIIKQATAAQASWQSSAGDLLPGTYIVKVRNSKDNTIIGNTKFIKQ